MPSFQVLPVENTKSDRDKVAQCLITAMYHDAYYRALYPTTPLPDLIHYASLRLGANLQNPRGWFLKIVADAEGPGIGDLPGAERERGGQEIIISYARYLLPAAVLAKLETESPRRKLTREERARFAREAEEGSDGVGMPKGINAPLLEVAGPAMAEARKAFPAGGEREAMTLDMLATLPTHQGKGAASALVKWGTDLADREELLLFLEATSGNEGFYGKFGFEKVSEARHDLRPWGGEGFYTHVFMMRQPKVVSGRFGRRGQ